MHRMEALERDLQIARQASIDAQENNDPRRFEYTLRSYAAWQRLELEKRAISQIGQ